mgnify:CR=1 FL=1
MDLFTPIATSYFDLIQKRTEGKHKTLIESLNNIFKVKFSKNTIEQANNICIELDFRNGSGASLLTLVEFMRILNGDKKPLELTANGINNFMQQNFLVKKPIFGIMPILDTYKINILEMFKPQISACFNDLDLYIAPDIQKDMELFAKFLSEEQKNKLTLRILGNNELILKIQYTKVQKFLEAIPEILRKKITVELLGKTGINSAFKEDAESEIKIMERMAKSYFGNLGVTIKPILTRGKFISTIDTIKTADAIYPVSNNCKIIYFMCPNAFNRQMLDIMLFNLQNGKTSANIFFDGCGGYTALEEHLLISRQKYSANESRFKKTAEKFLSIEIPNALCEIAKGTYTKIILTRESNSTKNTNSITYIFK